MTKTTRANFDSDTSNFSEKLCTEEFTVEKQKFLSPQFKSLNSKINLKNLRLELKLDFLITFNTFTPPMTQHKHFFGILQIVNS